MKQSLKICKIFGIDVNVHFSLIFILLFLTYVFYINPPPFGFANLKGFERLALSIAASVLIFVCILIHELSHSLVAIKYGSKVKGIVLFIFGGVALIENIPREPKREFLMALSGPAASIAMAITFLSLTSIHRQFFFLLGYFNLILGLFNLIPAFPMDGGRILRSILARSMGFVKATKVSAEIGKILAIVMAITGIFVSLWLILIALFIYIGASEEEKLVTFEGLLGRFRVKDIMTPDPIYVTPETKVREVIDLMLKYKHLGYPVVRDGELIGIVTLKDVMNADEEDAVENVMSKRVVTISPDENAFEALKIMSENGIGRIPVVKNGKLVGIVSRSDIIRVLEILEAIESRISTEVKAHTTA